MFIPIPLLDINPADLAQISLQLFGIQRHTAQFLGEFWPDDLVVKSPLCAGNKIATVKIISL